MEVFKGIDLYDSFVTSWNVDGSGLSFELEVSIWPESTYYSAPNENEYTCYKTGVLRFFGYSHVKGLLGQNKVRSSRDPDGSVDYGNVEYFAKSECKFEIHGEFGKVVISGGEFLFEINA
ncbi:hypothetical protein TUM4644_35640 [Shewanella colwelliana]|uniref:hypothetical protein n=1 Tax=Shewanella colwelliana TaxID=23 RepID=UPI001BC821C9|nr:hypothetical protein [Shewanella colwelliana]GIU34406.1 hypothetical protein TUM4644_35640 [Shewanella colwelliana]